MAVPATTRRENPNYSYLAEMATVTASSVINFVYSSFLINILPKNEIATQIVGVIPINTVLCTSILSALFDRALNRVSSPSKILQFASLISGLATVILLNNSGFQTEATFGSATTLAGAVTLASLLLKNSTVAKLCLPVLGTYIFHYLTLPSNSLNLSTLESMDLMFRGLVLPKDFEH